MNHSEQETDEELDYNFAGTAICFHTEHETEHWVIDTGATDHMTSSSKCLSNIKNNEVRCCIKLPNGSQVPITHVGDVQLCNDLVLKEATVVPAFKYNLLSVSKLCKDSNCIAIFHDEICLIQDYATRQLKGIGEHRDGLYHLVNSPLQNISPKLLNIGSKVMSQLISTYSIHPYANTANKQVGLGVWHQRLGHAPVSKLRHVEGVPRPSGSKEVCFTCPMAKFAKLPFPLSESHAAESFDLVHIDI